MSRFGYDMLRVASVIARELRSRVRIDDLLPHLPDDVTTNREVEEIGCDWCGAVQARPKRSDGTNADDDLPICWSHGPGENEYYCCGKCRREAGVR